MAKDKYITIKKMPKSEAISLIVLGILIAVVFIFVNGYFQKEITPEESISVNATFTSFETKRRRRGSESYYIHFSDHETLEIDSCCNSDNVLRNLGLLEEGEKVTMLVHPNSHYILEMISPETRVMEFNYSMKRINRERENFMYPGYFGILSAVYGVCRLIMPSVHKRRRI